jgi:hypothetical protein
MKKYSEYNSYKELPKKSAQEPTNLKQKSVPPSNINLNQKFQKVPTLAQAVPTLPESKFFPTSGRNLHMSQNYGQTGHTASANISTTNTANNSLVSPINLTVQRTQNESGLNFSMHTQRNEPIKAAQWSELALPATPVQVLKMFSSKLTSYEQAEILKYPAVYCIGIDSKKIKSNSNSPLNFGFDDENGDYCSVLKDHIAYRYEVFETIGRGSFGQVLRVFDYKHQCFCALKMIRNKVRFHQQAAIEIEVLKVLRQKDEGNSYNVVHIQSSFTFRNHIVIHI